MKGQTRHSPSTSPEKMPLHPEWCIPICVNSSVCSIPGGGGHPSDIVSAAMFRTPGMYTALMEPRSKCVHSSSFLTMPRSCDDLPPP
ncbi:hypothetical protein EXN66_Car015220 [Channa argus]|uniref:Uncharacterized protein n=1 Tax=Channa argus TaxID=215402 RepID=A0A6G1QB22_CHAAH|nr:hypothetical protein EXN66_Car015220 [Channa argus]